VEKLLKKLSQQKITEVRKELARAHLIIALLSVTVVMLLLQGATRPLLLDPTLSVIGSILLGIVVLISLGMFLTLSSVKTTTKKK
jgi:hypothetical protein